MKLCIPLFISLSPRLLQSSFIYSLLISASPEFDYCDLVYTLCLSPAITKQFSDALSECLSFKNASFTEAIRQKDNCFRYLFQLVRRMISTDGKNGKMIDNDDND